MADYRRVVTGVSTVIFLVKKLARLQVRYTEKITKWAFTNMSGSDYSKFTDWWFGIIDILSILEATPDD